MRRALAALVLAAAVSFGYAHAYLVTSSPVEGEVTSEPVTEISLEFSEPVETGFSTFKLVRVVTDLEPGAEDYAARLDAVAGPMASTVLAQREEQEGQVAFALRPRSGSAAQLNLTLKEPLSPGAYLLAWRVLSVDTHVIEGFLTFTVR